MDCSVKCHVHVIIMLVNLSDLELIIRRPENFNLVAKKLFVKPSI